MKFDQALIKSMPSIVKAALQLATALHILSKDQAIYQNAASTNFLFTISFPTLFIQYLFAPPILFLTFELLKSDLTSFFEHDYFQAANLYSYFLLLRCRKDFFTMLATLPGHFFEAQKAFLLGVSSEPVCMYVFLIYKYNKAKLCK